LRIEGEGLLEGCNRVVDAALAALDVTLGRQRIRIVGFKGQGRREGFQCAGVVAASVAVAVTERELRGGRLRRELQRLLGVGAGLRVKLFHVHAATRM